MRSKQQSMLQDSDLKLWKHTERSDARLVPVPILTLALSVASRPARRQPVLLHQRWAMACLLLTGTLHDSMRQGLRCAGTDTGLPRQPVYC
jgi:hypothetical protein